MRQKYRLLRDFRQLTAHLPEYTPVMVPAPDHSYRHGSAALTTALFYRDGYISEDHGDEHSEPGFKRLPAIVIT